MTNQYVLSIDQGTTSSRAIVFDKTGQIVSIAQQEFPQIYPQNGWVEHDPEAIWSTTLAVSQQAFEEAESKGGKIIAIGITNQRETTIIWDRKTHQPVYNAIVWQDRRTAGQCQTMREQDLEPVIQSRTGLLLDPYFSASKVSWILDNVAGARSQAENGELAFGTVDCFLIWRLTGGKVHATDITNASRTSLFNIHTEDWDSRLLELFNLPDKILPDVRQCADNFGETVPELFGRPIPILGVAGDQQAAAFGQCCFNPGDIKSTYGTGCFVMINSGNKIITSHNRLLTTVAYKVKDTTHYALEGSIFMAGAAVQWLRDGLGIIKSAGETGDLAQQLEDNRGVYLVPAFTGLGAPHWKPDARGAIFGLSRDSGPAEIVRATLESVCYQTRDLLDAMKKDGIQSNRIRVDGGMVANDWLMQFLADILDIEVDRPAVMETTALGVAYLASLQAGLYDGTDAISKNWQRDRIFTPAMDNVTRGRLLTDWQRAVDRLLGD